MFYHDIRILHNHSYSQLKIHSMYAAFGAFWCDYLLDMGIQNIAVFAIDDSVEAFYWQAYQVGIEVKQFISNTTTKIDFSWNGCTNAITFQQYDKTEIKYPLVVCCQGKLFPWGKVKIGKNKIYDLDNLIMYSYFKRTVIKEIKELEKSISFRFVICCLPYLWNIKDNKSNWEKSIANSTCTMNEMQKIALSSEYSNDEWRKIWNDYSFAFIKRNGVQYATDYHSEFCNSISGYRVTTDTPGQSKHRIFVFGNSAVYGWKLADKHTLPSYIQRLSNADNSDYCVINCANIAGNDFINLSKRLSVEKICNDDVIVIAAHLPSYFETVYAHEYSVLNFANKFRRPHEYGELFLQSYHYTPVANHLIAEDILRSIQSTKSNNKVANAKPTSIIKFDSMLQPEEEVKLTEYIDTLKAYRFQTGAIVVNCNPFTLGHRYLIEYAAEKTDKLFVFVVEEDKSFFPFKDRLNLVKQGTQDLSNVIVVPSGRFIISSLTFEAYGRKEQLQDVEVDPSMDVEIFAQYIAPSLGITVRFAGEEPLDNVTRQYNEAMSRTLPKYGVEFEVIPRKKYGKSVISASKVRKLLEKQEWDKIEKLVPKTTLEYLRNSFKPAKDI